MPKDSEQACAEKPDHWFGKRKFYLDEFCNECIQSTKKIAVILNGFQYTPYNIAVLEHLLGKANIQLIPMEWEESTCQKWNLYYRINPIQGDADIKFEATIQCLKAQGFEEVWVIDDRDGGGRRVEDCYDIALRYFPDAKFIALFYKHFNNPEAFKERFNVLKESKLDGLTYLFKFIGRDGIPIPEKQVFGYGDRRRKILDLLNSGTLKPSKIAELCDTTVGYVGRIKWEWNKERKETQVT